MPLYFLYYIFSYRSMTSYKENNIDIDEAFATFLIEEGDDSESDVDTSFVNTDAVPVINGELTHVAREFWFPDSRECECCKGFQHACECCSGVTNTCKCVSTRLSPSSVVKADAKVDIVADTKADSMPNVPTVDTGIVTNVVNSDNISSVIPGTTLYQGKKRKPLTYDRYNKDTGKIFMKQANGNVIKTDLENFFFSAEL